MSHIRIQQVTKIFGSQPHAMLEKVHQGMDKTTLLNDYQHGLGVYDINLEIQRGEIFVIMGLSGSGKSTLIRHFNRLIDPTEGQIIINGQDITQLSQTALRHFRRDNMSMVFQHFGLMPHRKVIDNVGYGLSIRKKPKADITAAAHKWLDIVGLNGYHDVYPKSLSGGQQQRVGLARALATNTDILLMDEAFSALDPLIRSQMQEQLLHLQAELNKTIIFITHDLSEALRLGTRIAILNDGKLAQIGTPEAILLNPADDYVRDFVQDVNRSRVVTAGSIMRQPQLILDSEKTVGQALEIMSNQGVERGWLPTDKAVKLVTHKQLIQSLVSDKLSNIAEPLNTLTVDTTIERLIPMAIGNTTPIPLLNDSGNFVGVIDAEQILGLLRQFDMKTV